MTKATFKLPDGTVVAIEGATDEIKSLLDYYSERHKEEIDVSTSTRDLKKKQKGRSTQSRDTKSETIDLPEIINLVKNCDEADAVEERILNRTSQVDRTLLPLYIVHEYLNNAFSLSSGDISKITTDLGVPVATPNVSRTLSSTASKYVIGDRVRKQGQPVKYKLSRRGVQYIQSVIRGSQDEDKK